MPTLREQLAEHQLTPEAVVLTHGHFDHVFNAGDVCAAYDVPAYLHPADHYMLTDPAAALGPGMRQLFDQMPAMTEVSTVVELADGQDLSLAGLRFDITHSPGHTDGSVLVHAQTGEGGRLVLAGDTLFAGGIGRTDLPGGDHDRMLRTLSDRILPLDDDTAVLPGHGPTTTIGQERASNSFLTGLRTGTS